MKYLMILIAVLFFGCAQADAQENKMFPIPTITAAQSGGCCGGKQRQRLGNNLYMSFGLISINQFAAQSRSLGNQSQTASTGGSSKRRPLRRLIGRRR